MKKNFLKAIAIVMASSVLFSSCASSTWINTTNVDGADVYLNGEYAGTTPHKMRDTKIVGSSTDVVIEEEGYLPLKTSITRDEQVDVGAVIGGIFFLFPFLWTMKYKSEHNYMLKPDETKGTD